MKKKSVIGAAVMAAMILLAVPLGANRSLASLRDKAMGSYYYDNTGFAIFQGIEAKEEAAQNLITVANRYSDKFGELVPLAEELSHSVSKLQSGFKKLELEKEASLELDAAAQALTEALEGVELSESDAKYPRELLAEIQSEQRKISRSSYNEDAREFNARLEKAPISMLRPVIFVDPMTDYS